MSGESKKTCAECGREPGGIHLDECSKSRHSQKILQSAARVVDLTKTSFDEAVEAVRKVAIEEAQEAAREEA